MAHVIDLSETIGDRQVSSPGLQKATEYMMEEARKVQALAAGRSDVVVKVLKQRVAGAVSMSFTRINFTNVYRGLDNVMLVILPLKQTGGAPPSSGSSGDEDAAADLARWWPEGGPQALLIASHYDSAVCSTGAADDVSQVAVMLETARVVLSRPQLPAAPVVFLWTGGEEPISPAAHGWMQRSPLVPRLGAFINLEAMGGGGLPIIFQHTGAWTLEAYARGAPHARGARVAQDVFDAHIIPADSDYRMFSARHYGNLPGVDVAFIVDSTAYHTYRDRADRFKKGILQEMGENLVGATYTFTQYLAEHPEQAADPAEVQERAAYFDLLGCIMVSYRDKLAQVLHNVPLALALGLPLLVPAAATKGRKNMPSLAAAYRAMLGGAARTLASVLLAVLLPVVGGVVRVLATGKPMIWFDQHWVGHLLYLPLGAVGVLIPQLYLYENARANNPENQGLYVSAQLQGCALTSGLICSALTAGGLTGNAMAFGTSGLLAALWSPLVATPRLRLLSLLLGLALAVVPLLLGGSIVGVFIAVMMERMALAGSTSVVLGDMVVAVLCGAASLAVSCGALLPPIAYSISGVRKPVIGTLLLISLGTAAYSNAFIAPYSPSSPKRIVLNHILHTQHSLQEGTCTAAACPAATAAATAYGDPERVADLAEAAAAMGPGSAAAAPAAAPDPTAPASEPGEASESCLAPGGDDGACRAAEAPEPVAVDESARAVAAMTGGQTAVKSSEVLQPPTMHVVSARMSYAVTDSTPLSAIFDVTTADLVPADGREFTPVFPLGSLLTGCTTRAKLPATPLVARLPGLVKVSEHVDVQAGVKRLQLAMFNERPSWGVLNVTGDLAAWSFTEQLAPSRIAGEGSGLQYVARFTTQDPEPFWHFWLDVRLPQDSNTTTPSSQGTTAGSGRVRIEMSVSYLDRTAELEEALSRLPTYVSESWLATVYYSEWEF